jgi:hypothetical protein
MSEWIHQTARTICAFPVKIFVARMYIDTMTWKILSGQNGTAATALQQFEKPFVSMTDGFSLTIHCSFAPVQALMSFKQLDNVSVSLFDCNIKCRVAPARCHSGGIGTMGQQISNNQRVIAKRCEHQRSPTVVSAYAGLKK